MPKTKVFPVISSVPDMLEVMGPATKESTEVLRLYTAAGGDVADLIRWISELRRRPHRARSNLERWKESVGGMLRWSGLPPRYKSYLEEIQCFLLVTLETPAPEPMQPKGVRLPSLVAAVLYEEFRRRFPNQKVDSILEDIRHLLMAYASETFPPDSTRTDALRKRIQRIPRHILLHHHRRAFPTPR